MNEIAGPKGGPIAVIAKRELQELISFAAATGAAVFLPGCDVVRLAAGSTYSDHQSGSGAVPSTRGSRHRD